MLANRFLSFLSNSPLSSVQDEDLTSAPCKHTISSSLSESITLTSHPITFEESLEHTPSSNREEGQRAFPRVGCQLPYCSSGNTKSSLRTSSVTHSDDTAQLTEEPLSISPASSSKLHTLPSRGAGSHVSVDGYLQPPVAHKPSRRNTIGTPGSSSQASPPRVARMMTMTSSHPTTFEDPNGELADDIEQQAEQIRRERIKRAKQQEAERALTRSATTLSKTDDRPLVGNLIGEDHVNYVLMYNMLTGIRIAVSTSIPRRARPLMTVPRCRGVKPRFGGR